MPVFTQLYMMPPEKEIAHSGELNPITATEDFSTTLR
jgi:hypothetical protein